jgi:hypothetical protein
LKTPPHLRKSRTQWRERSTPGKLENRPGNSGLFQFCGVF